MAEKKDEKEATKKTAKQEKAPKTTVLDRKPGLSEQAKRGK
jgi:hypothetical protein